MTTYSLFAAIMPNQSLDSTIYQSKELRNALNSEYMNTEKRAIYFQTLYQMRREWLLKCGESQFEKLISCK